jgi:hypothetical protein
LDRVWTPVGGEPVVGRLGMSFEAVKAAPLPYAAARAPATVAVD